MVIDKDRRIAVLRNRSVSIWIKKGKVDKEMIKKNGLW
jgi:hypothetical protein